MTTHSAAPIAPSALSRPQADRRLATWIALAIVYIVWGTTYLAISIALESFPPYWMMAIRFGIAGVGLYVVLRLRGVPNPTLRQWRDAAFVGALLLGGGIGTVALAEEQIDSGLAAALVAIGPLWAILFARLLYKRGTTRSEWIGVAIGIVGVALLSLEGNLQANPEGLILLLIAPVLWSFGSVLMQKLDMPDGFMGSAAEMIGGAVVLVGMALARGEAFPTAVTPNALLALVYLIVFGSLLAMTAYNYLLKTVSPAMATSYSFVNPAIALLLGGVIGGEIVTGSALLALPIILVGVGFVLRAKR